LTAVTDLHYLPCVAYFSLIQRFDSLLVEKHEFYIKQSYRNRTYINTAHGSHCLIVPVTAKHGKTSISDVRIDYSHKWVNNHWRSIRSGYGKAPFFEYYAEDLEKLLFKKWAFLFEMNQELLTMCLRWLRLQLEVKETLAYEKKYHEEIFDGRSFVNAKNTANIGNIYRPVSYQQVFGNSFVENLSLLDLIFCCGPEAGRIVKASSI
jgi:hypothetical protein